MTSDTQQHGRQAWEAYGSFLDQALSRGQARRFDPFAPQCRQFAETSLVSGALPTEMAEQLVEGFENCPEQPTALGLAHRQFDETDLPQAIIDDLNTGTVFYRLSAEVLWRVGDIFDHIRDTVAASFGAPWRVLGVRGWSLNARSAAAGPNDWHLDGLPLALCKIMIFPTALDAAQGTLQIRFPDGREEALKTDGPGWVLFRPSELPHRGIPPQDARASRYTVEATVVPAPAFKTTPFFAGNNARHPYFPWYRASYDGF